MTDRYRLSNRSPVCPRAGFTIVELLVVIAILALLVGLGLPAVGRVREAARRTQCANNLKQIATAVERHDELHEVIPHNGGWDGQQTISKADGSGSFTPWTEDFTTGKTYRWGVGDPKLPPRQQTGSWLYSILPFVEQQSMFDGRHWESAVGTYICPSRRRAEAHRVLVEDEHGRYDGGGWRWGKTDYAGNGLLMQGRTGVLPDELLSLSEISDGLSQTILAGEKAFDPSVQVPATWYWDEPFFLGGSAGTARRGVYLMRDAASVQYKGNWGSPHVGGVQFVFGDGSVRQLGYDIPWQTLLALLTPNDGDKPDEETPLEEP